MVTSHPTRLSLVRCKRRFVLYFVFSSRWGGGDWGGSRWEGVEGRSRGEPYIVTDGQQSVLFCFWIGDMSVLCVLLLGRVDWVSKKKYTLCSLRARGSLF